MDRDNLTDIVIEGRPDFADHSFGVTQVKSHPPYVYGPTLGLLVHKVAGVELHWYAANYNQLIRRKSPSVIIRSVCGQTFFTRKRRNGKPASATCSIPKPDAVLCGRCHGEGPVFAKGCKPGKKGITRQQAKARIGCVIEAEGQS